MPPLLRWLIPAVAVLSSALAAHAAPDSVVTLNEILYHPPDPLPPATTAAPEWIELHNPSDRPIQMIGWTLGDASSSAAKVIPPDTLAPGAFVVLTTASNAALFQNPAMVLPVSIPSLNNDKDSLVLSDG